MYLLMKRTVNTVVAISLLMLLLQACKKDKDNEPIEGVTGFAWKVYSVQQTGDQFINPIPDTWSFSLTTERKFSFTLDGSVSAGSFSWNQVDSASANVEFNIDQWNNPFQSPTTSSKLKTVVQSVDKVFIYKPPFSALTPAPPPGATVVMVFQGSAGNFNVYR